MIAMIRTDPDWYEIAKDGEVIIRISRKLSNAWYLTSACNILMAANQDADTPTKVSQ